HSPKARQALRSPDEHVLPVLLGDVLHYPFAGNQRARGIRDLTVRNADQQLAPVPPPPALLYRCGAPKRTFAPGLGRRQRFGPYRLDRDLLQLARVVVAE